MSRDDLIDNFTKLVVAILSLIPWVVGLRLDLKRRKEKKERERRHNTHIHHTGKAKTKAASANGECGEDRSRHNSRSDPGLRE